MKKLLLIYLVFAFTNVFGQNIYVGSGTTPTLYGPIYIYSAASPNTHSWNLSIYTQSEILAAGGFAGLINQVSWYKVDTSSYPTLDASFEIYMKHTTLNEFATAGDFNVEVTGATLVFDNQQMSVPSSTGWFNFILSNYFNWNGVDNIMILTRWVRTGNATGEVNWQASITAPLIMVSHSFNSSSTMGTLYTNGNRPNIQLGFVPSTNIDKDLMTQSILIYPNPVKDFIVLDKISSPSLLSITDLSGKIIFTTGIEAGESQVVKLPELEKGIYGVKVLNDSFSYGTKIIVVD